MKRSSVLALAFGVVNLWSVPIPAVSPAVSFHVPIPGFPPIGYLGTPTVIGTQAGAICGDFKIVNTGAGAR